MLHNLKRTIISTRNGYFGGNMQSTTTTLNSYAIYRCLSNSTSAQIKCWSCGSVKKSTSIEFKCSKCQSLLDLPKNLDHFELLNIEKKFNIDSKMLTNQFRQIQSVLHPDKFSNKSDKEQNLSAEWSSLVNKAYKVLMSPIQRAEYLLKSHQIEIPEGNTAMNSAFLMEMMERNEQVDEAESKQELVKLLNDVHVDCQKCIEQLEKLLAENKLTEAKDHVIILRYLLSLENSIKEKGNRIGIIL